MPGFGLTLDTCALLALASGRLKQTAVWSQVRAANEARRIAAPAIVALDLAQKASTGKLDLGAEPEAFFRQIARTYELRVLPIKARVAFAAYTLPEPFHRDPGDRVVVAFARLTGWPVVTSDRKILAYAHAGHVAAVGY